MGEKYSQSIFMVVASVYARVTDKYDVLRAGCFQTTQKPQALESSINKSSWPVNPVVVPVSGPATLAHSQPANTHELSKIGTLQITHSGLKIARRAITDGRTVPTSFNANESSVFLSLRLPSKVTARQQRKEKTDAFHLSLWLRSSLMFPSHIPTSLQRPLPRLW